MSEAKKAGARAARLNASDFFLEGHLQVPPKAAPPRMDAALLPEARLKVPPKAAPPRMDTVPLPEGRLKVPPKAAPPRMGAASPAGGRRRKIPVFERNYAYRNFLVRWAFRAIDLAGGALFRRVRQPPGAVRRVLLMRPDGIGDIICALPALRALRERLPKAQIDFLAPGSARSLVKDLAGDRMDVLEFTAPWADLSRRRRGAGFSALQRVFGIFRLRRLLRVRAKEIGGPYDLALDLRGDFPLIAGARLAGARWLVGRGVRGMGFWLDAEAGEVPGRHQVERNLDLLARAGLGRFETKSSMLTLSEAEIKKGRVAASAPDEAEGFLVGIHPGARPERQGWNPERYAELIGRLVTDQPARVLLFGEEADREFLDAILTSGTGARIRGSVQDMSVWGGDLRSLMGVMKACRVFIGDDSGPAHLAAALGVPVICISRGHNEPAEWAPRGPRVLVLRSPPRSRRGASTDGEGREVARAYEAVMRCV